MATLRKDMMTFGDRRRRRIKRWHKRTLHAFEFMLFVLFIKGHIPSINDVVCSFSVCLVPQ